MTNELKETIKNFLVEWKNKDEKDIDLWDFYWEALEILEQVVENK